MTKCGECSIGVRFKGILCTGPCTTWHHFKCLNWPEKKYKSLTKLEIETWRCKKCIETEEPPEYENIPVASDKNGAQNPQTKSQIEKIEEKIQNLEGSAENNLDTSLNLAAELGNALLAEKASLQREIETLTQKNFELSQQIGIGESSLKSSYEAKLEELESENQDLSSRLDIVTEKLLESDKQLNKELQTRNNLEKLFEEHDTEKENIISAYEKEIRELKKEINSLKRCRVDNTNLESIGTQTETKEITATPNASFVNKELLIMKNKQIEMEALLKQIQFHLLSLNQKEESKLQTNKQPPNKNNNTTQDKPKLKENRHHKPNSRTFYMSTSLQNSKYRAECTDSLKYLETPRTKQTLSKDVKKATRAVLTPSHATAESTMTPTTVTSMVESNSSQPPAKTSQTFLTETLATAMTTPAETSATPAAQTSLTTVADTPVASAAEVTTAAETSVATAAEALVAPATQTSTTRGDRQTPTKKLNLAKTKNATETSTHDHTKPLTGVNTKTPTQKLNIILTEANHPPRTVHHKFKITISPPITAKKLQPHETSQSFFENNIAEAQVTRTKELEKTNRIEHPIFLGQIQQKESIT